MMFRIENSGQQLVVSISHPSTSIASLVYEHAYLQYLHPRLPQIPAPIPALDGSTWFTHERRLVTLFPLMPGAVVDRDQARLPAARFLAQYHQVALAYPDQRARPDIPAWWQLDWERYWDWPATQRLLNSTPTQAEAQHFWQAGEEWVAEIVQRRDQLCVARHEFRQWATKMAQKPRPLRMAPIHDDYHRKNLLLVENEISALIDWDGCHPDWLLLDTSVATWEFCVDKAAHTMNIAPAQEFVQAYREAGGPIKEDEIDLVIPLICLRRVIEILSDLQKAVTGDGWNADTAEYLVHNLIALEKLAHLSLFD